MESMLPQKLPIFIAKSLPGCYLPPLHPQGHSPHNTAYLVLEQQAEGFPHANCPSWLKCVPLSAQLLTGLLLHGEGAETARDPARVAGPGSASLTAEGQAQQESIELVAPSEDRGKRDAKAAS